MRRKFTFMKCFKFMCKAITIMLIVLGVQTTMFTNQDAFINNIPKDEQTTKMNGNINVSSENVNNNLHRRNEMEDFTLYNLLDPKEQFDAPLKKYEGFYFKRKVILLYNKPSFENEITTNEKFKTCDYNNCLISSDKRLLRTADAILFDICTSGMGTKPPISRRHRNPNQAWIFKCGETPVHYFYGDYQSPAWHNTMNWSITYRLDSDMPHPYGYLKTRLQPMSLDYESIYSIKNKTALWVVSNCHVQSARDLYVAELEKYGLDIDIYGRCGPYKTIKKATLLQILPRYKFYLGFENSLCKDYITEKFFHYYKYSIIIVVRGGADYGRLLPTDTYINTANFPNASLLAEYLSKLGNDKKQYVNFLRKKDRFEAKYGFGHKYSICETCRRLNNLSEFRKTYGNIADFLKKDQCKIPTDVKSLAKSLKITRREYLGALLSNKTLKSSFVKDNVCMITIWLFVLICFVFHDFC